MSYTPKNLQRRNISRNVYNTRVTVSGSGTFLLWSLPCPEARHFGANIFITQRRSNAPEWSETNYVNIQSNWHRITGGNVIAAGSSSSAVGAIAPARGILVSANIALQQIEINQTVPIGGAGESYILDIEIVVFEQYTQ